MVIKEETSDVGIPKSERPLFCTATKCRGFYRKGRRGADKAETIEGVRRGGW
jgi:hypothetical protein